MGLRTFKLHLCTCSRFRKQRQVKLNVQIDSHVNVPSDCIQSRASTSRRDYRRPRVHAIPFVYQPVQISIRLRIRLLVPGLCVARISRVCCAARRVLLAGFVSGDLRL